MVINQLPTPFSAPRNGRPAALAACAVLAAIVNAGAIGLATQASARWRAMPTVATERPPNTPMTLTWVPDEPAATAVPAFTRTAEATVKPPSAPRRAPRSGSTARVTPVAEATGPPQQIVFYTYREVDSPAFPESDWNLDVGVLDEIGVQRLVFEVLVSDHGQVVGCTVLQPADLADDVKRGIEKRLSETALLPALRAGRLVASVRRIELLVASAPPAATAEPLDPAAHRP